MKRILIDVLAILAVSGFLTNTIYAQGGKPGDIDGDGKVSLSDLSVVLSNFGGSQDTGIQSTVKATIIQHVGSSDTTVYQAKVVVRESNTNKVLGEGLTDRDGKSPEWKVNANTDVDIYAYPPVSSNLSSCGSVQTFNTGVYGNLHHKQLRIQPSNTVPCVLDKVCTWTP